MNQENKDSLWSSFLKTLSEYEARFHDEASCHAYLDKFRWDSSPLCAKTWAVRGSILFECTDFGHQTSLTSGTLIPDTRKPFKFWFRAIREVTFRRNALLTKDLQRILGFGSYETAWTRLHNIGKAIIRPDHVPLLAEVQLDEGVIGGKGSHKSIALVGVVAGGRIRINHTPNNDDASIKDFADRAIDPDAEVSTDGLACYNARSLGEQRSHKSTVQSPAERRIKDDLQLCHWAISNLKRWLMGTHLGAVSSKHLQSNLDGFIFLYIRREAKEVGRLVERTFEYLMIHRLFLGESLFRKPCLSRY